MGDMSLCECRVYADRQRLSGMVVDNLLPTDGGENVDPTTGPKSLNAITVQLEENLKEEQRFNCQMLYTVFKHCLNPVQVSLPPSEQSSSFNSSVCLCSGWEFLRSVDVFSCCLA